MRTISELTEIPTVTKFIELVKDVERICNQYHTTYDMIQRVAEILDDFGWDVHPEMILSAYEKEWQCHSSVDTMIYKGTKTEVKENE